MKRILKFILPMVIAAALGTTGLIVFKDNTEYYVDTTYFQSTYAYKDDVDLSGLKIIETEKDEVKAEHQVDESMVTSCDSTNSVGEKTLVLTYDKEVFTVNFIVMYEIKFISDNEVYNLQYVLKASEIKMPEEPKKSGYEFKGWSPEVPNVINDNMTFEAVFSDTPESIPNLGVYEATYGDTLESIKLPSNQYGSWKFVDELTTKVGNVGTNTFDVEFIPTNSELKVIKDTVQITVGKKTLEFKNVVTTFDYDGEEHLPTYELEVEGINVVTMGTPGIEVGTYFIMFVIQDANYEGQWQGNFTIKASEISISFDLTELSDELGSTDAYYSIQLGENVPTNFAYTVVGIDNPSLLQLKLVVDKFNHAGTYEVTLQVGNESYKNVKFTNKCYLVVEKTSLGAGLPTLTSQAIYDNRLSTVTIEDNNPNGYWAWENPDYLFDYTGEHIVNLVFTPYSSLDYETQVEQVVLNVMKRELTIKVVNNVFTYELDEKGNAIERNIEYVILDGENEITGINVTGQINETVCGKYETELVIVDDNYSGRLNTNLKIEQATPDTNFDIEQFVVIVGTTLADIKEMPEGYTWLLPTFKLEEIGEFEYDVVFTPEDTQNYKTVNGKFDVKVIRKTSEIIIDEIHEFIYGDKIKLNVKFPHEETEPIYTYYLNDKQVDKISDAGEYAVVIVLPESNNYNAVTATTIVNVTKKEVKVSWNSQESYVYQDRVLSNPVASFFDVTNTYIELEVSVYSTLSKETVEFKNAGSYYFVANTSEFTNYVFTDAVLLDIVVEKAEINLSNYAWNYTNSFMYDGKEHKVELFDIHEALTPVYTENAKIDAGTYTASVTFEYDENNYILSGKVVDCNWEIVSSFAKITWSYEETYTFTGYVLPLPKATILDGTVELIVSVEGGKEFRNADTYVFVASIEEGNYTLGNETLSVVVEKASLEVVWAYETTYVYSGEVLAEPTAKVTDLLGTEVNLNIVSNKDEFKNAGDYSFDASFDESYLDQDNYVLLNAELEDITIEKADYDLSGMAWDYDEAFVYNGSSHEVELKNIVEGLTPYYEDYFATNAGKYTASVTFGYDMINYNTPSFEDLDWEIVSKVVEVEWTYETEYVYTGSILVAPTATYENVEGEVLSLLVKELNGKEFKTADEYTFVASISADETIANNYTLINDTLKVSISSSNLSFNKNLTATYGDTLADVESQLPDSEFGTWSFVDDLSTSVGNAGKNEFMVRFESSSDNYESYETGVIITVEKKEVVINVVQNTFTYDGSNKTILVKILDGEVELDVNVLGNETAKNAGTYNATLRINDNNYTAEDVESSLVIEKAEAVITNNLTETSSDYDGNEIELSDYFVLNHKETEILLEVSVARNVQVIKNAGVYTIVVKANETANYLSTEITVVYTVNKITAKLEYNKPETSYIYNGSEISVSDYVSHDNTDSNASVTYVYQLLVGETYTVVNSIVEAGTYKVIASIDATTNFFDDSIEFEVVVEKGHLNVEDLDSIQATYGQQLNHFDFAEVKDNEGNIIGVWSWENPDDYVGNVGENTHIAVFTPEDDSMDIERMEVKFIVSPKEIKFTLGQTIFDYDGDLHTVTYTLSETPEGVAVKTTGTISATDYVAGGYEFGLEITGNENYIGSISGTLIINQISSGVTAPTLNAVYNNTYADITLPENENGTWSFVAELSTSVGNVGAKSVILKFTPNSQNYKVENVSATLFVAKADYTPNVIPTTYDAVYGDLLSTILLPTTDTNGTWRWDTNGTVGNAGINKFTATFTHDDNNNYNIYQTEVAINVARANATIENNLPDELIYTGSELIEKHFTLNHSEGKLVFTVTGKDTSVVSVGSYTVVVSVPQTANYNALTLDAITVEVKKADPKTDFTPTFTYTYGKVLDNNDLSKYNTELGHYEWTNQVKLEVGTNQKISAKFVPNDKDNYNEVPGYFYVTIEKIAGTITVSDNQTFTYGEAIDLGATTNNKESEIEISGLELNADGFVNAGTYTVTLTVDESAHYTKATKTITVVVEKKEEEFTLADSFEYGTTNAEIESTLASASQFGTFTVHETNPLVNTKSVNYNTGSNELVVETKSIWILFTPSEQYANNYAKYSEKVTITIVKRLVRFTDITNEFTYEVNESGEAIVRSVGYKLVGLLGDDTVNVEGNVEICYVNQSTNVTLTIVSDHYYGTWSGKLTIKKAIPETNFDTKQYDVFYNTTLFDIDLEEGYKFVVNDTLRTIGDGQLFEATYTPTDTDNYEIVKGKYVVNVKKLLTEITVNNLNGLSYIPGKTYTVTASASSGAPVTITVNGSETYTIGNADSYNVVVTSPETDYYQAGRKEYTVVIEKAIPENSSFSTVLKGTWGNTLASVALTGKYAWKDSNESLDVIGEKKYIAIYTPEDTANYKTVEVEITIDISKAIAEITVNDNQEFEYNPNFTNSLLNAETNSECKEFTYVITSTNGNAELKEIGTYTVVISLPETAHFTAASETITVVIKKANPNIANQTISNVYEYDYNYKDADYNKLLNSVVKNVSGTFEFVNTPNIVFDVSEQKVTTTEVYVTFIPNDQVHYEIQYNIKLTVEICAVAYIGSTNYGTIEKAVDAANSTGSGTIWVYSGVIAIIRNNITLNSNVSMVIPYEDGKTSAKKAPHKDSNYADISQSTLVTTVNVLDGVVINVNSNATLEIGGELSGAHGGALFTGHTGGKYARVVLHEGAQIISNGTINSFGYIEESSLNNNSKVTLNAGTLYAPFVLRDFRGGSFMKAVNDAQSSKYVLPFNQFEMRNIESTLRVNYNAKIIGMANLYASYTMNNAEINYIGNTSDFFIQLTDAENSYITIKYDKTTEVQKLDIYGGGTTNGLKLKAIVTVNSEDYYFPISWRFNMSIHVNEETGQTSADYKMDQRFKLLPGAVLLVDSNTNLTLKSMTVYDDWKDIMEYGGPAYANGQKLPGGKFIVKGSVVVNDYAGRVYADGSGARFEVKSNVSNTTYEPLTVNASTFSSSITSWQEIQNNFNLTLLENHKPQSYTTNCQKGVYYSKNSGWYTLSSNIIYHNNGVISDDTKSYTESGLLSSGLTVPTREHYIFDGWYYDSNFGQKVDDVLFGDLELYAKWTPITYGIQYVDKFYSSGDSSMSNANQKDTFTIEENRNFAEVVNSNLEFNGYYLDEALTINLNGIINGAKLIEKLSEKDVLDEDNRRYVTIYLYWYPEGSGSFTVKYINEVQDVNCPELTKIAIIDSSDWAAATLPDMDDLNYDSTFGYFFEGWFIGDTKIESINEGLFDDNKECTLTAKWSVKRKVIVNVKFFSGETISSMTSNVWYNLGEKVIIPTSIGNEISQNYSDYLYFASIKDLAISLGDEIDTSTYSDIETCIITLKKLTEVTIKSSDSTITLKIKSGNAYNSDKTKLDEVSFTASNSSTKIYILEGSSIEISHSNSDSNYELTSFKVNGNDASNPYSILVGTTSISAESIYAKKSSGSCVIEGTLITMADGTTKPVEEVVAGDLLLIFNHETGMFDVSPVIFNEAEEIADCVVINLVFSNGSIVKVISEHGFFDYNLMQYVYITELNYMDFVGHEFAALNQENGLYVNEKVVLTDAYLTYEYTRVYSPVTVHHLNYYTENMLSMPGGIEGLFNMFVYGDNLQYNQELMEQDIEMYGLYTYEDFEAYIPYEVYAMFPAAYLKISVAKGLITFEEILGLIDRYIGIIVDSNM